MPILNPRDDDPVEYLSGTRLAELLPGQPVDTPLSAAVGPDVARHIMEWAHTTLTHGHALADELGTGTPREDPWIGELPAIPVTLVVEVLAAAGAILTPEQVHTLVIQPLIEQSVAAQVSTVVQTSSHDLRVPRVTADPAAAWTQEGAEIGVSDATLDEIVVTPRKLAGLVVVSNELAADSSPAALQVVGDGLVRDLLRKIDSAYFGNTVANGPSGLGSLTTSTAANGGSWASLDSFEAAKSAAETLHTQITAFVANPATALALSTIKEYSSVGSNKPLLQADPTQPTSRTISGVPLYVSPAVANDIVWGVPRQHSLFVLRQGSTVVTDSSVFFTSDRVAVEGNLSVCLSDSPIHWPR